MSVTTGRPLGRALSLSRMYSTRRINSGNVTFSVEADARATYSLTTGHGGIPIEDLASPTQHRK